MTYVVLARKWRPQLFADVVGQESITRTLENSIKLNRVSHGLLLTGARGVGKTTTARILAKALNCEKGPTVTPCGTCSNCVEITSGTNVDVLEIDGASNTSVDDVRELRENIRYRPSKSRNKIYIIDEVHMLSTSAFNALLKTLEEPPPGVVFIFATTEPHKIPDTILSRCQRHDFKQISDERIAEHLSKIAESEKLKISENSLALIARQASGSLRDSLSMLDQVVALAGEKISDEDVVSILGTTDRELITKTLQAFIDHDAKGALDALEAVFSKGFDPKTYLLDVWERVRDLLVIKAGGEERLVRGTSDEREQVKNWAVQVEEGELEKWFDLLRSQADWIGRSEFPRYLLEVAFLKATRKEPRVSFSTLIDRLESLEARLGGDRPGDTPRKSSSDRSASSSSPGPIPVRSSQANSETVRADRVRPIVPANVKGVAKTNPAKWEALVNAVKRQKPAWAAILLQAQKAEMVDEKIALRYDEGSFYVARAKDHDFQEYLTELACELFGVTFSLDIQTGSKMMSSEPSPAQVDRAREKEALENPVVQKAVSLFEAKIDAIKPAK